MCKNIGLGRQCGLQSSLHTACQAGPTAKRKKAPLTSFYFIVFLHKEALREVLIEGKKIFSFGGWVGESLEKIATKIPISQFQPITLLCV